MDLDGLIECSERDAWYAAGTPLDWLSRKRPAFEPPKRAVESAAEPEYCCGGTCLRSECEYHRPQSRTAPDAQPAATTPKHGDLVGQDVYFLKAVSARHWLVQWRSVQYYADPADIRLPHQYPLP